MSEKISGDKKLEGKYCGLQKTVTFTLFFYLLFSLSTELYANIIKDNVWEISYVKVVDKRFPTIPDSDFKTILSEARSIIKEKTGIHISFIDKGEVRIETFIDSKIKRYISLFGEEEFNHLRINMFSPSKEDVVKILSLWEDIRDTLIFLPKEVQVSLTSRKSIVDYIGNIFIQNLKEVTSIKMEDGSPLIPKEKAKHCSLNTWLKIPASYEKTRTIGRKTVSISDYDIYITNAPIIVDVPMFSPHPITTGIINGVTIKQTILLTTFPLLTDYDYWREIKEGASYELRLKLIGFILAHEIGHLLFRLPDRYQPDFKGCLMYIGDRDFINIGKRHSLMKNTGICKEENEQANLMFEIRRAEISILDGRLQKAAMIFRLIDSKKPSENYFHFYLDTYALLCEELNELPLAIKTWQRYLTLYKKNVNKKFWSKELIDNVEENLKNLKIKEH